jgi:Protein of unknown function (DUF2934)
VPEKKATTRKTTTRKATARKPARKPAVTPDMIAERAYFIALERGGSQFDNWVQAEQELVGTK